MTTHYGKIRRVGVNERMALERRKTARQTMVSQYGRMLVHHGWRVALVLCVLGLLGWSAYLVYEKTNFSKVLVLKKVSVHGNRLLSWEEIVASAGLELGMSMFAIREDSIVSRLTRVSLVREVKVQKRWPSGVRVDIEEARPLFLMKRSGGGFDIWSDQCTLMPAGADLGMNLPVVSADGEQDIAAAHRVLLAMKNADNWLYNQVSQVVENRQRVEVFFRDVTHKVWFSPDEEDVRVFARYRLLVKGFPGQVSGAAVIDMRFPGLAVTIPQSQEKDDG